MSLIQPHPERETFLSRLRERSEALLKPWSGDVFRFVNPRFSRPADLFSGKGALHTTGRWNLPRIGLVSCTSLTPETAMAESFASARYYGFPLSQSTPLVLVSGRLTLRRVLDLRDGAVRQKLRISQETITKTDWKAVNALGLEAVTQAWGWAMLQVKTEALVVPSAAYSAGENLVLFPDNLGTDSEISLIKEVEWPT